MMKRVIALAAVAATALTLPATAATKRVKVGDDWFGRSGAQPTVKVKKGDRVKWVWVGKSVHNVYVTKGPQRFNSRTIAKGSYTRKIRKRGTYEIVCTIHPGMEMTLKAK